MKTEHFTQRNLLFCIFVFLLLSVVPAVSASSNLLPEPRSVEVRSGQMSLRDGFSVHESGGHDPRIDRAVARLYDRLALKLGFTVIEEPVVKDAPTLEISCGSCNSKEEYPRLGDDESYTLSVSPTGAVLQAPTAFGILHGLETFYQLAANTADGFGGLPAVDINDAPRFQWRGLLFDVARHYMPMDVIEREIDGLSAVKMNVLHLHLSDDQSFRVESKKFPELTKKGSHGQFYTQEEIKELLAYARDRGIRIVPEFDVPGHSTAWLAAFPELAVNTVDPNEPFIHFGGYKNTIDPSNPKLMKVLDKLFGEMAALFPDEYFHIGGDEVVYKYWDNSPSIAEFKQKHKLADDRAVQAYFNTELEKILHKHHKIMVGWNEILHADLPKTTVVQSWTGVQPLEDALNRGYRVVCSLGFYLDWYMPASFYYSIDPLHPKPQTFEALEKAIPNKGRIQRLAELEAQAQAFHVPPDAEKLVLGGEAAEWSEMVGPWDVDAVMWPRLAAIAERLWSPATVTDVNSLYERFDPLSLELSDIGITSHEDLRKIRIRLAGSEEGARILGKFADVLEPTKYYTRNVRQRSANLYNLNSPLNRLVDAVPPESKVARQFESAVDRYLKTRDPEALDSLQSDLRSWKANDEPLSRLVKANPRVSDAAPLVDSLHEYCQAAEDAIRYLQNGAQAAPAWVTAQREMLGVPVAEGADLKLAIAPAVMRLVEAASTAPAHSPS